MMAVYQLCNTAVVLYVINVQDQQVNEAKLWVKQSKGTVLCQPVMHGCVCVYVCVCVSGA